MHVDHPRRARSEDGPGTHDGAGVDDVVSGTETEAHVGFADWLRVEIDALVRWCFVVQISCLSILTCLVQE